VLTKYGESDHKPLDDNGKLSENVDDTIETDDVDSVCAHEPIENIVESFLCGEAMMMSGCLEGVENAGRSDWMESVTTAKTLSRFVELN
jgi:hypothetical protein